MTMTNLAKLSSTLYNCQNNYKHLIKYPVSKLIINIISLCLKENLIRGFFFKKVKNKNYVYILLKYSSDKKMFNKIIFSSPKKIDKKNIKNKNGFGLHIISTSKGLMSISAATKLNLGGKPLLHIN